MTFRSMPVRQNVFADQALAVVDAAAQQLQTAGSVAIGDRLDLPFTIEKISPGTLFFVHLSFAEGRIDHNVDHALAVESVPHVAILRRGTILKPFRSAAMQRLDKRLLERVSKRHISGGPAPLDDPGTALA